MFNSLLRELSKIYQGDIYLPDPVYEMVKNWMSSSSMYGNTYASYPQQIEYRGRKIFPYDEEKLLAAYQSTPIHVPERILEKSTVIEVSLEPRAIETPVEKKDVKPREPDVRYGRREGTKIKDLNKLF